MTSTCYSHVGCWMYLWLTLPMICINERMTQSFNVWINLLMNQSKNQSKNQSIQESIYLLMKESIQESIYLLMNQSMNVSAESICWNHKYYKMKWYYNLTTTIMLIT